MVRMRSRSARQNEDLWLSGAHLAPGIVHRNFTDREVHILYRQVLVLYLDRPFETLMRA